MPTQNLHFPIINSSLLQSGNGVPSHIAPIGSLYVDLDTATEYINKNGIALWVSLLDSTYVFTGGTGGSTFTGGTVSGETYFINGLTSTTVSATTYQNLQVYNIFKNSTGGIPTGTTGEIVRGDSIVLTGNTSYFSTAPLYGSDFGTSFGQIASSGNITGFIQMISSSANGSAGPNNIIGMQSAATTTQPAINFTAIKSLSYNGFNDSGRVLFSFRDGYLSPIKVLDIGTDYLGFSKYPTSRVDTATTTNYLSTDSNGKLVSKPLSTFTSNYLPLSGGTINGIYTTTTINGSNSQAAITISGSSTVGGSGYTDFIKITNTGSGATNTNKTIRLNNTGGIEVVNSAYNGLSLTLSDSGNLSIGGAITVNSWSAGQVIKDTMLSNTEVTVNTTTIGATGSDVAFITYSYTPVSSNSYLIVHYHLGKYDASSGTGNDAWYSRIAVDGGEIVFGWQNTINGNRSGTLFPLIGRYTNSNTTAKTITITCRKDTADDSIIITNSSTSMWMRITEIAR